MLYSMKLKSTTAAAPRVVDAHGLLHRRVSKAAKACDAADVVDGLAVLRTPRPAGRGGPRGQHWLRGPRPPANAGTAPSRAPGQAALGLAARPSAPQAAGAVSHTGHPAGTRRWSWARASGSPRSVDEIGVDATRGLLAATEKVAA